MEKKKALTISFLAILSVVLVEGMSGFITGSLAILSDAAHALFDAVTSFILLVTTSWSLKPPDEEHLYGHEKIEAIGGLIAGVVLSLLASFIIARSFGAIILREIYVNPEFIGFVGIFYTLCVDVVRIGVLRESGESVTVEAGLYHAFADFASTIIALSGFGLSALGFYYGDPLASIILGVSLIYLSIKLVRKSALELSDAISSDIVRKIKKQILKTQGILECRELKIRKSGPKTFVEATVIVPAYMGLKDAHALASIIESNIAKSIGNSVVTIHMEPEVTKTPIEKQINKLATSIEGVKKVHNISCTCKKGRFYITLHAQMNPKFSVEEAHKIAEEIENQIRSSIEKVKNVTVHIEPYSELVLEGISADKHDIHRVIVETVKEFPEILKINRILTYIAEGKRHINIDCSFNSHASIERIHEIVSETEKRIRKKLDNTMVTIHSEPETQHSK